MGEGVLDFLRPQSENKYLYKYSQTHLLADFIKHNLRFSCRLI